MAVVGNSVVSDPLSLVVNLDIQIVNQVAVDMNRMEFVVQLVL